MAWRPDALHRTQPSAQVPAVMLVHYACTLRESDLRAAEQLQCVAPLPPRRNIRYLRHCPPLAWLRELPFVHASRLPHVLLLPRQRDGWCCAPGTQGRLVLSHTRELMHDQSGPPQTELQVMA